MRELIFLSSTLRDLAKERKAVFKAFDTQYGVFAFEHRRVAIPNTSIDVIRQKIKDCTFFILIIGESSGTPLIPLDIRITQVEWEIAIKQNKKNFVFEKDVLITDENLIKFREKIRFHYIPAKFKSTNELIQQISDSIREHISSLEKSREALEHSVLPDLIALLEEYRPIDEKTAITFYKKMLKYPTNPYSKIVELQINKVAEIESDKTSRKLKINKKT